MIRLLLPLLALLTAPAAAAQATASECTAPGKPALWVVEDADSRIYLFGTVSALPKSVEWFGPEIEAALAASDELVTEIAESDLRPDPARIMRLGSLPDGQTLAARLAPEQADRIEAAASSAGLPTGTLAGMRPWMAAMVLGATVTSRTDIDPAYAVEPRLYREARSRGLAASGLETTMGQLEMLANLPEPVQVRYLMQTAEAMPAMDARLQRMIKAWLSGDLCDLEAAMAEEAPPPEMLEAILLERNRSWASTVAARLDGQDDLFVAVTAGHFVGPGNLIELLAWRGLTVRRVQ